MPDKQGGRFTEKEDRQAEHIKQSEKKRGKSEEDAERIGLRYRQQAKAAEEREEVDALTARQANAEPAALAGYAFDGNRTPHRRRQFLHERQP